MVSITSSRSLVRQHAAIHVGPGRLGQRVVGVAAVEPASRRRSSGGSSSARGSRPTAGASRPYRPASPTMRIRAAIESGSEAAARVK